MAQASQPTTGAWTHTMEHPWQFYSQSAPCLTRVPKKEAQEGSARVPEKEAQERSASVLKRDAQEGSPSAANKETQPIGGSSKREVDYHLLCLQGEWRAPEMSKAGKKIQGGCFTLAVEGSDILIGKRKVATLENTGCTIAFQWLDQDTEFEWHLCKYRCRSTAMHNQGTEVEWNIVGGNLPVKWILAHSPIDENTRLQSWHAIERITPARAGRNADVDLAFGTPRAREEEIRAMASEEVPVTPPKRRRRSPHVRVLVVDSSDDDTGVHAVADANGTSTKEDGAGRDFAEKLESLMMMGFGLTQANVEKALQSAEGDISLASRMLSSSTEFKGRDF